MFTLSDRFRQFAAAHLRTTTERHVYAALAGSPEQTWTVGRLAAAARVSHHEADQAMRRFVAATIAEEVSGGHGPRFRWRPSMAYLAGPDDIGPGADTDPVCGMPVDDATPHAVELGDDLLRFCSLRCLILWRTTHREVTR